MVKKAIFEGERGVEGKVFLGLLDVHMCREWIYDIFGYIDREKCFVNLGS